MSESTTRGEKPKVDPKRRWLEIIRQAAESFMDASPLSIPEQQQKHAMDRVVAAFRAAAAKDQKGQFYQATPESLGRAIALCALTGLMPGGPVPEVDLIPRQKRVKVDEEWVDGPVEITWQIGWRGYVTLTGRAGCHARSVPVYGPDLFVWEEGLNRRLDHTPKPDHEDHGEWSALRLCYVVARYRDGFSDFEVMTRKGIEDRRAMSESWRNYVAVTSKKTAKEWEIERASATPWVQWPIDMARKTAIRYAASRGLLPFDEVGHYGIEADKRADVIDSTEIPTNGRGRALPDYDPLGQEEHVDREREPVPTRGVAAVAAAVSPAPSPSPLPTTPGAPPGASGGAEVSGAGQPDPEKKKTPPMNSVREADIIQARLITRPRGVPIPIADARQALKEGIPLARVPSDERLSSALNHGVVCGYWEIVGEGDDRRIIMPATARSDGTREVLVPATDEDIRNAGDPMAALPWDPTELYLAIEEEEGVLQTFPKLAAQMPGLLVKLGREAGLPIDNDEPQLDGAPPEFMRRYLFALRQVSR